MKTVEQVAQMPICTPRAVWYEEDEQRIVYPLPDGTWWTICKIGDVEHRFQVRQPVFEE